MATQGIEPDPDGGGSRIKHGARPDRQIRIHDPDMRHGRKSSSKRFNGYKQHVMQDLDAADGDHPSRRQPAYACRSPA